MPVIVFCKQCNKEMKKKPSDVARGEGKYCSMACRREEAKLRREQQEKLKEKLRLKKQELVLALEWTERLASIMIKIISNNEKSK